MADIMKSNKEIESLKKVIDQTIKELNKIRKKILAGDNDNNVLKELTELQKKKESILKRVAKARGY